MTSPTPLRRPLPLIAVVGPILAIVCALIVAIPPIGAVRAFAAIGAAVAAALSALGAFATRPGTHRRGFALSVLGVVLGVACAVYGWTLR